MKALPSLKQLEYLVALADTLHFAKASERCNVTASTLSAGIQELERLLETPLAERTKRRVLLTPLGDEVAGRARKLLRDAEDIVELATTTRGPLTGELRLGSIPTVGPFLLPRVLMALRHRYPSLRLMLEEGLSQTLLDHLREGSLDLALVALPYAIGGLAKMDLFDDEFVFACNRGHPFARRRTVSTRDLAGQPLMLLEEGHCLRAQALKACRLQASRRRVRFEASSFHTLTQMVGSGIGVTLLPRLAVEARVADAMDLALVPLAERAQRHIALVWRKASPREREFRLLGAEIQACFKSPKALGANAASALAGD